MYDLRRMKPVVTSIVALVLAIVPFAASAAPAPKARHHAKKASLVTVRHTTVAPSAKARPKSETVMRHAHGVDVSGGGHHEPIAATARPAVKGLESVALKKTSRSALQPVALKVSAPKVETPELPPLPAPALAVKVAAKRDIAAPSKAEKEMAELVALIRAPAAASAGDKIQPAPREGRGLEVVVAKTHAAPPAVKKQCVKEPFEIIRGPEMEKLTLTTCDGKVAPFAVEHLSVLVRPGSAARPTTPIAELAKKTGKDLAPGIRRVDERLALKLQAVVDHFTKDGITPKVSIVSGYRPTSTGSMHATGRAVDFRVEGIKNEEIVSFCKTLDDAGCGFYPNSSFVHLDVRDPGAKTSWIDASGPGEAPRYVSAWPPREVKTHAHDDLEVTSAKVVEAPVSPTAAPEGATAEASAGEETEIR